MTRPLFCAGWWIAPAALLGCLMWILAAAAIGGLIGRMLG